MKYPRLAFVLIFACIFGYAQTPPPSPAQAEQEKRQKEKDLEELKQKALAMLDELVETGRSLRLPENRCLVLSTAANHLWPHDEKRARELFVEATAILTPLLRQANESPEPAHDNFQWQVWEMRLQLVGMLTRLDPQLANDFFLATRPPAEKQGPPFNAENESHLEAAIAQQLMAKDPLRQLQYAEEMLAAGKPPRDFSGILYSLRDKNPEAAQKLAGLIFAKLEAETPLSFSSTQFALQLVQFAPQPNDSGENPAGRRYLLSAAQARALIEKALAGAQSELAAARQNPNQRRYQAINFFNQLKNLSPYMEKHLPAGLAAFKRGMAEVEQMMDPGQRTQEALNKLAEKGSVDALLEAAAKAPAETRRQYFQNAARMANQQGNVERARQIVTDNITDKNEQRYALQELDRQILWRKINEQKFDEARQLMAGRRDVHDRVNTLVSMAQTAHGGGKKEMALDFLAEAWALMDGPPESGQQLNNQLQLAGAYIPIDSARGFEIIESSIERFNEVFAATATIESFERQGTFRNKEMVLRHGGGRGMNYLNQYAQHLATLAVADLDRVPAVIARFARPDTRAHLQLTIVQRLMAQLQQYSRPAPRRAGVDN